MNRRFFTKPPAQSEAELRPEPVEGAEPVEEVAPEVVQPPIDIEAKRRESEILSTTQYILEPHIPEAYKEEFRKYEMLFSRTLAVSNITKSEVYRFLDYFDLIILWLKFGRPDIAVKRMCRLLMELQLDRSVGFAERLAQISTRQVVEQLQEAGKEKKKRGLFFFR